MSQTLDTSALQNALKKEDYDTAISEARSAIAADATAAVADPVMQDWLGRRFRNIFMTEAEADPEALKNASAPFPLRLIDPRSNRERVAKRNLKGITTEEIKAEMPHASASNLSNTTFLFAPGLLTGLLPKLAFQSVWPQVTTRFGIRVLAADSHPMRSSEANVADLENAIERGIGVAPDPAGTIITADDNPKPPGDVFMLGYSKGSPDIISLIAKRPDLAPRIRGVASWAGATGGSYLANGMYDRISSGAGHLPDSTGDLSKQVTRAVMSLAPIAQIQKIDRRIDEYDIPGALRALTTGFRDQFLEDNWDKINSLGIPYFSFTGATSVFDVPYFQWQGTLELAKYDINNDMQVTQQQARWPNQAGPNLAMFQANHWDLSYDKFPWYTTMGSTKLKDPFARKAAMCSIVLFMAELGIIN